jgi:lipoate-protein ligase A
MAIDLALLDRAELAQGWVRLYTWNPHCLSFGRHEPAARRYDSTRIQELGLDTVRRPTGGRAVWHAHELTYAIAAPHQWFGSLRAAYAAIHSMLAGALEALGVPATLALHGRTAPLDHGPCFAHSVGGEVLVSQRKVIGSAQLRRETAMLQHGSIILEDDQRLVEGLVRDCSPSAFSSPSTGRFTLTNGTGRPLSAGELANTVGAWAQHHWIGDWQTVSDPQPVLRTAAPYFDQFQSSAWTWNR